MMMIFVVLCCLLATNAFQILKTTRVARSSVLNALDKSTIDELEAMTSKFTNLSNVDSPESDAEAAKLKEMVEKYKTYGEVNKLMTKIRNMYVQEVSESRKDKQIKSFMSLCQGKRELEELIQSKLGKKEIVSGVDSEIAEVATWDAKIAEMEEKLKSTEMVMPGGQSTRAERFDH